MHSEQLLQIGRQRKGASQIAVSEIFETGGVDKC